MGKPKSSKRPASTWAIIIVDEAETDAEQTANGPEELGYEDPYDLDVVIKTKLPKDRKLEKVCYVLFSMS